eukprot:CAMPEP_0171226120 /NCGR_PEP_ID=MMETSP0790-20130122/37161_1 /TAXON_ID=2925 /ORGANISM="Alexandrium catenella, Strain OF101" /LENGTH=125 /DNA_ID=CAMNT_0011692179 /DNA_START=69 /DNA_END=446 /DNA_ORIENTATION=-
MAVSRVGQLSLAFSLVCALVAIVSQSHAAAVDDTQVMVQAHMHQKQGKNIAEGCPFLYECLVVNCTHQAEHCLRTPSCANGWWRCLINHCGCYDWQCHGHCRDNYSIPEGLEEPIELCALAKCMR